MRDSFTTSRARELRRRPTDAERHLWRFLRRQYLGCRFRRQVPIGPYIADFASLSPRIVVEIDGGQHTVQRPYDRARDQFMRDQGFIVLRFWSNEVLLQTEAVLQVIWQRIREPDAPPSCPSPARAGEGTHTQRQRK